MAAGTKEHLKRASFWLKVPRHTQTHLHRSTMWAVLQIRALVVTDSPVVIWALPALWSAAPGCVGWLAYLMFVCICFIFSNKQNCVVCIQVDVFSCVQVVDAASFSGFHTIINIIFTAWKQHYNQTTLDRWWFIFSSTTFKCCYQPSVWPPVCVRRWLFVFLL